MLFLRKPKHKKEVVATSKGWEVKETGELLVRIKDLDTKIINFKKEFNNDILPSVSSVDEPKQDEDSESKDIVETPENDSNDESKDIGETTPEPVIQPDAVVEQPEVKKPKRRGRPAKQK